MDSWNMDRTLLLEYEWKPNIPHIMNVKYIYMYYLIVSQFPNVRHAVGSNGLSEVPGVADPPSNVSSLHWSGFLRFLKRLCI